METRTADAALLDDANLLLEVRCLVNASESLERGARAHPCCRSEARWSATWPSEHTPQREDHEPITQTSNLPSCVGVAAE